MNFTKLQHEFDTLRTEYNICRRKLDSKCEALLILSKDLDRCRQERDQFKLMAEQVQARYQGLKRQLAGVGPRQTSLDGVEFADMKQQNLAHLLCEMREVNKSLQFEVDDYKQKLNDAQGDIKLLREQIARQRLGSQDEGMTMRHFPAHEREDLVRQLETSREKFEQLERDLQQCLDEKEELVTERDVYKNKYERLNNELNYILKGDEKRIVDIDAMSTENKYLHERIKQMEEEKSMALATVSKYKTILEKKKNKGIIKLGQSRSGGVVISQKQVHQLLETKACMSPTPQMLGDLQSLSSALLETLNDKNLALSHQRKTNKILGGRVSELENKLKTLEVSGLWNVPQTERASSLQKLKKEFEELQNMAQGVTSQNDLDLEDDGDLKSSKDLMSGMDSAKMSPNPDLPGLGDKVSTQSRTKHQHKGLSLEDLDFLPTKDNSSGRIIDLASLGRVPSESSSANGTPLMSPEDLCKDRLLDDRSNTAHVAMLTVADISPLDGSHDTIQFDDTADPGNDSAKLNSSPDSLTQGLCDDNTESQDNFQEQDVNLCLERSADTDNCDLDCDLSRDSSTHDLQPLIEDVANQHAPQASVSTEDETSSVTSPGCMSPLLGNEATDQDYDVDGPVLS